MRPANPFQNNPLVRGTEQDGSTKKRFPWVASAVLHVLLLVAMLVLPARFIRDDVDAEPIDIVFYKPEVERPLAPPPDVAELVPELEPESVPLPEPVVVAEVRPEPVRPPVSRPLPPQPKPAPRPEPVVAKTIQPPSPVVKQALPVTPIAQARPKPRPAPKVGSFGESRPVVREERKPEPVVASVGAFGSEPEPAPPRAEAPRNRVVAAGSFGGGAVEVPREPATRKRSVVTQASFNATPAETPAISPSQRRVVSAASFNTEANQAPTPSQSQRSVNEGGFGTVENTTVTGNKRSLPSEDLDTPVEIVSKPKPAYTSEARDLRVEGEVVLKVTFTNSGQLQILGVVDGLGYGLDEAAIEAAKKIKFTPARRDGRPVNHTATLRVVFRLA